MFKIALVVFRECLEISMVLGIICAATKSIQNSVFYITAGIMGGIICAAVVAFFITKLTFAFGGFGEELFDVAVIMLTVVVVGATAIWVRNYSGMIKSQMDKLSTRMEQGTASKFILTAVVTSTIFREVMEILLYTHALATAYDLNPADSLLGFGGGITLGIVAAVAIYYGLSRIALKYLFKISFIMLVLIAASLASEAAGILTSIGFLGLYNEPLWDTSWIISDLSVIGRMLKILVGYDTKPNFVQIMFYIMTVILILVGAKLGEKKRNVKVVS